ncbi:retron system putative HNH endonuclease [Desulfobacterales bacterium HSG16]|nr:retron system putative HNH endonuclease [Desulfobacterales bacterium HSG16]
MRYIEKQDEPDEFVEWKERKDDKIWNKFKNRKKRIVKNAIVEEQGYICCYCGKRIHKDRNTRIEHLKSRSKYPDDTFNYKNLLVSCFGGDRQIVHSVEDENDSLENISNRFCIPEWKIKAIGANKDIDFNDLALRQQITTSEIARQRSKYLHCDPKKGNHEISITPLMPDCDDFFRYKINGEMISADSDDNDAKETIDILGLNSPLCKDSRKAILDGIAEIIDSIINQLISSNSLTKENLQSKVNKLIEGFNQRDENGQYAPYCFVSISYLKTLC